MKFTHYTAIACRVLALMLLASPCTASHARVAIPESESAPMESDDLESPQHVIIPSMPLPPPLEPRPGPDLAGLATWYGDESHRGRETRSGDPYDPDALTCAVPDELWDELAGKTLRVEGVYDGSQVIVRVNDTGYLSEAGRFTWAARRVGTYDVARWWPDDSGLSVVVDLTPAAHHLLSAERTTVRVKAWIVEEEQGPGLELAGAAASSSEVT